MGIFKNVINSIKESIKSDLNDTETLSSEEKKLDSILKEAAKDAFVKLIPTDRKNVYQVDVTLNNGKPISYYGNFRYIYDLKHHGYEYGPNVTVSFVSYNFDDEDKMKTITTDLTEWRDREYGRQYNTLYCDVDTHIGFGVFFMSNLVW